MKLSLEKLAFCVTLIGLITIYRFLWLFCWNPYALPLSLTLPVLGTPFLIIDYFAGATWILIAFIWFWTTVAGYIKTKPIAGQDVYTLVCDLGVAGIWFLLELNHSYFGLILSLFALALTFKLFLLGLRIKSTERKLSDEALD